MNKMSTQEIKYVVFISPFRVVWDNLRMPLANDKCDNIDTEMEYLILKYTRLEIDASVNVVRASMRQSIETL